MLSNLIDTTVSSSFIISLHNDRAMIAVQIELGVPRGSREWNVSKGLI